VVAYYRSFSDIPYAMETSKALRGEEAARQMFGDDLDLVTRLFAPVLEARYKCFDRFTRLYNNVLELAVGTSVERGMRISGDPDKIYVGTDLPELIAELRAFLDDIDGKKGKENFYLEGANVLSYEQLRVACAHFHSRRGVLVINEGLLIFLTMDEQAICAENVRKLLECYGGKWITTDITCESGLTPYSYGPEVETALLRATEKHAHVTGRNLGRSRFSSEEAAIRFFQEAGFNVKRYPMVSDLGPITSITRLWQEPERRVYEHQLRQHMVWEMSLS
jgi:O-methyltransferase involved in polyketide biosynthesis